MRWDDEKGEIYPFVTVLKNLSLLIREKTSPVRDDGVRGVRDAISTRFFRGYDAFMAFQSAACVRRRR